MAVSRVIKRRPLLLGSTARWVGGSCALAVALSFTAGPSVAGPSPGDGASPRVGTASLSGTVSPAEEETIVRGFAWTGSRWVQDGYDWADAVTGEFELTLYQPGTHRLVIVPPAGTTSALQWWPQSNTPDGAGDIAVAIGDVLTGFDMVLPAGGRISGTMQERSGGGTGECFQANLAQRLGRQWFWLVSRGDNGDYTLFGVPPGLHRVQVGGWGECDSHYVYEELWWKNAIRPSGADLVEVAAGETTIANFVVRGGNRFGGEVRSRSGRLLSGIRILMFRRTSVGTWQRLDYGVRTWQGRFEFIPRAGLYKLRAVDPSGKFRPKWYGGTTLRSADAFRLAWNSTYGVNLTMRRS